MMRPFLSAVALVAAMVWADAGKAQSLDELPGSVAAAARQFVTACRNFGGRPRYEPLDLVKLIQLGADMSKGGRESYVVDTSRITCTGAAETRPWCGPSGCRLLVLTPRGARDWRIDLDTPVSSWRITGPNGSDGPYARLEIVRQGAWTIFTAGPGGLQRAR